ncbi:MAG: signal peptidase II [Candidatus Doudnabacteria bacterium]|nr:signal peptidase II [Candidatus Doudnabacteria bacterium]
MNYKSLRPTLYILGLTALDQITKAFFAHRDFFLGFMKFHLVKNYGLSFGANFGIVVNTIIILTAVTALIWYIGKFKFNSGFLLISAGAIANLLDRLQLGYVRDFWDIGLGFTFNLADLYIIIGLLLLVLIHDEQRSIDKQFVE